jgi:hypothetical protein
VFFRSQASRNVTHPASLTRSAQKTVGLTILLLANWHRYRSSHVASDDARHSWSTESESYSARIYSNLTVSGQASRPQLIPTHHSDDERVRISCAPDGIRTELDLGAQEHHRNGCDQTQINCISLGAKGEGCIQTGVNNSLNRPSHGRTHKVTRK